jgi:hypothetical protein
MRWLQHPVVGRLWMAQQTKDDISVHNLTSYMVNAVINDGMHDTAQ